MKYLYYPGCSLKGSGRSYEESLLASFKKLGVEMHELPDWNCCGATAYMAVDEMKAFALAARNLALAERYGDGEPVTLVAPCNACYLALMKVQKYMAEYDEVGRTISDALASADLSYRGGVRVRQSLDVLLNDVGLDLLAEKINHPLGQWKVACYYGCQAVRPFAPFDDEYNPMSMDHLMRSIGAEPVDWPLKARCCGGTLTGTIPTVGLRLSYIILREAIDRGANVVATACPLCQFNLECYQSQMGREYGEDLDMPIVYYSQLLGQALGIDDRSLGLQRHFVPLTAAAAVG
ncbi:MAG: CoB--CoM heterodisulfide reductase iron-sulfur subunit B family protein [Phycisphaerales bacterium]|nr:MAG: CoB--CoM heterodisulfide reductase iron-sulfur subunit B family protein [Phycisphaerales bacterium]